MSVKYTELEPGLVIGKLTLIKPIEKQHKWLCRCSCGNLSTPSLYNLRRGSSKTCGHCKKNYYSDCDEGKSVEVTATNGIKFYIDKSDEMLVRKYKWSVACDKNGYYTVVTSKGLKLHTLLMNTPREMEVDHIDLDRMNNRRENLRLCTHQQNQCNKPLQKNNTSEVSGVGYYPPRHKFRARIKVCQHDVHLGYYETFDEAVMARNVGMACMFGEYGRYNMTVDVPLWIVQNVKDKCRSFADLSICKAFFDYAEGEHLIGNRFSKKRKNSN